MGSASTPLEVHERRLLDKAVVAVRVVNVGRRGKEIVPPPVLPPSLLGYRSDSALPRASRVSSLCWSAELYPGQWAAGVAAVMACGCLRRKGRREQRGWIDRVGTHNGGRK